MALIIDGNGRWATEKGLSRSEGHKAGAENLLNRLLDHIMKVGVKIVSIYVFSTENFKRSEEEVNYLMKLFTKMIKAHSKRINKLNIKVVFSGRSDNLKKEVLTTMDNIVDLTKNNTEGIINFCFNYGGKAEIVDATKKICNDITDGSLAISDIDEDLFSKYLYIDLPPVDLMIRTSGEMRLSNFLLWQNAYAEFYFSNLYFPDFDEAAFDKIIENYQTRNRRFGGIKNEKENA